MLDALSVTHAAMYLGAGLSIGFGAIGAAVGEGYTAGAANEALSYRPEKAGEVVKNMLVGQAVAESAAIFALVIAIILIFTKTRCILLKVRYCWDWLMQNLVNVSLILIGRSCLINFRSLPKQLMKPLLE